jgi:hypothetical protein
MLIISDEDRIGDALSGLPFIYYMAESEQRLGRTVYLMFKNKEVLSLVPADILRTLRVIEELSELWSLVPRIGEQRIAHLYVRPCHIRYGTRYHMMEVHFINHGVYLERWEPPRLDFTTDDRIPTFDFVLSPYSRSDYRNAKVWPLERWQELVAELSSWSSVCVVGSGEDERVFENVTYFMDQPLRDVCGLLAKARRAVLTIDNGMSHLAHALRVPHFSIYPAALAPTWTTNLNANAYRIVAAPLTLTVAEVREALAPLVPEVRAAQPMGESAA